MSQLTDNLNLIASIKSDISAAIEAKGVSMSGVSFGSYADKIGEIQTGGQFVTEPLSVSANGTYVPSQGVDGYSQVTVNVPQSVTGYTLSDITTTKYMSESVISDPNVSYIDMGRFCGVRLSERLNHHTSTLITPNNTTHYYFINCTSVYEYAFSYNKTVQYLSLPNCLYIGSHCFENCNFQSIDLPSCSFVASYAFRDASIVSVSLPNCEVLYNDAFSRCYYLQTIDLHNCITLGSYAFATCSALSEVSLPMCSMIYDNSFDGCSGLRVLTLNSTSLTSMTGRNTFRGYNSALSILVPSSLVDTYKNTGNWKSMSSHIFPIQE